MAEFYGAGASIQWIYSGGTATLSGNYRQLSYKPSIALLDITAGNDATNLYLAAQKDGSADLSGLEDTGGTIGNVSGTLALVEGTSGTLVIGPEGTATGKPKKTIPAICMGIQENVQYKAPTEFSVTFQQNGLRVDGTF
jgi:hypothetical protein